MRISNIILFVGYDILHLYTLHFPSHNNARCRGIKYLSMLSNADPSYFAFNGNKSIIMSLDAHCECVEKNNSCSIIVFLCKKNLCQLR